MYLDEKGRSFGRLTGKYADNLPILSGPLEQKINILQVYQKLGNILRSYGLRLSQLNLDNNQIWELTLKNGIKICIGKYDIEKRVIRFCKAYPTLIVDKNKYPARVDMRYPSAMAVQWAN